MLCIEKKGSSDYVIPKLTIYVMENNTCKGWRVESINFHGKMVWCSNKGIIDGFEKLSEEFRWFTFDEVEFLEVI